jgi:hypothetical protein
MVCAKFHEREFTSQGNLKWVVGLALDDVAKRVALTQHSRTLAMRRRLANGGALTWRAWKMGLLKNGTFRDMLRRPSLCTFPERPSGVEPRGA